jgi:hypothetical protein
MLSSYLRNDIGTSTKLIDVARSSSRFKVDLRPIFYGKAEHELIGSILYPCSSILACFIIISGEVWQGDGIVET